MGQPTIILEETQWLNGVIPTRLDWSCFLHLLGDGCSRRLMAEWILTPQHWTKLQKGIKRARQINFINIFQ